MIELPYKRKFDSIPEIDIEEIVRYFNLEFGVEQKDDAFTANDFQYLGVFDIDGFETMCWAVEGQEVCATVRPYEDTFIIEMGDGPDHS